MDGSVYNNLSTIDGNDITDTITAATSGSGGGGSTDLTNYWTKSASDQRYLLQTAAQDYVTDSDLATALVPYQDANATLVQTTSLINQAMTAGASQYAEYVYDSRIVGALPVTGSQIPLTQNQISVNGATIFSKTNPGTITISAAFGLEVSLWVEFSEDNAGLQRIQITPNWVAGDDLIYQSDNGGADLQPDSRYKQWLVQTTAGQQLNFTITQLGFVNVLTEFIEIKVLFRTVSYNSSLFVPQSNISIANVQNLQIELNSRYIKGSALDMQLQPISNIGGLVVEDSYRISDNNLSLVPVNFAPEHHCPKYIIEALILEQVSAGGGQNSILSTGSTSQAIVRDQPSQIFTVTNNGSEILSLGIAGGVSTMNCGSLLFSTLTGQNWIQYDDISNFTGAADQALAPKGYVDQIAIQGGNIDLSQVLDYSNDVTSQVVLDTHIPTKKYVDDAIISAGAGFDISNAPLIRYDATIDNVLISSDLRNLVTVDWVQSNVNAGDIYTLTRLNQVGNRQYTLTIDNNGRLTYSDSLPKTWFQMDTDASETLYLNAHLELQGTTHDIIGPRKIELTNSDRTQFSEYGPTECVQATHIQQYIDDIQASNASNAIVSTASNLQKLVITGGADTSSSLIHTMFATSTNTNTDTLVCSADVNDNNRVKYRFNESWPTLNQDLLTVQEQTDPQILVPKQYCDSLVSPLMQNLKVNQITATAYGTYQVVHNLGLALKDLVLQFYLVITQVNDAGLAIGTQIDTQNMDYNGNQGGLSYSFTARNTNNLNSFQVRTGSFSWGVVVHSINNTQHDLLYNQADLYVNIIGLTNLKIANIQNSLTGSIYSLGEVSNNFLMKNLQTNTELDFCNQFGDRRFGGDFIEFRSYANAQNNDPSAYVTLQSQDVSVNGIVMRNAADNDVFRVTYSGSIQYTGSLQNIALSSMDYKAFVFVESHYSEFLEKPFRNIWFRYKSEISSQFGRDPKQAYIGYLFEDIQAWDPSNKFGMWSLEKMKDVNRVEHEMKTVNIDQIIYFQVASLQYHANQQAKRIDKLEAVVKQLIKRLDKLEESGIPTNLNQTFDSVSSKSVKLVPKQLVKKPTISSINLK